MSPYDRAKLNRTQSRIDQQSPQLSVKAVAGFDKLTGDARAFLDRTSENVRLLMRMSKIRRSFGDIDMAGVHSFNSCSGLLNMQRRVTEVDRQNVMLGRRLLNIKRRNWSTTTTNLASKSSMLRRSSAIGSSRRESKYLDCINKSSNVFEKYAGWDMQMPCDASELSRLLRPRIILHFGVMDGRPLGQVVVQLYTEAAPLVVLQFVRTCMAQRSHELSVRRIFPNLWLEGYLLAGQKTNQSRLLQAMPSLADPMEFDSRVVDHARHGYVLSCAKEYCVHGFPGEAINFSISFKPLRVASGLRVGFGRVVRGDKVIECMQGHGTKNGKISKPLVITHCDIL
ncbi:hypothetical protein KR018_003031 [Drosophila ironensis]|nr:hypothetical protein KR018_003031 [Drosophila ironensis]